MARPKPPPRKTTAALADKESAAKTDVAPSDESDESDKSGALLDTDAFDGEINTSLLEVLDLLAQEVERLKVALEFYRLSEHPEKDQLIRWHVQQIDQRQDHLEDIKSLILAKGDDFLH